MFSLSLESCEVKENEAAAKALVKEINDLVGDHNPGSCDLMEAEQRVYEGAQSIAQKLLEMFVNQDSSAKESEPVSCPACDHPSHSWRRRELQITTLCGVICVRRWVYCCPSKHYHQPWDMRQKLQGKYTHRVVETMCRLSARHTYREAADELSRQGIKVSHTTLNKIVREWTKDLRAHEQVECQTLGDNERWYVSSDGCHTNSPDGWREVKVGCIYRDFPQLGPHSVSNARPESLRYIANRQNAQACGNDLYALATRSGIYQEDIDTQEVVFIGDGAAWIWNLSEEHFPNAVEIVDYMHATSHLYDVGKCVFGETATDQIEAWIQEIGHLLFEGKISDLAAHIRAFETEDLEVREILDREARYFEKHAKRMRYQEFRDKGYQIGSGVIESACKHVVSQRCKQASMRWEEPGINAVLKWRCLFKNDSWDNYWYPNTKAA